MNNNIKLTIKEYLGNNQYIDASIILYAKTSISPFKKNDITWEGNYKNQKIKVILKENDTADFAEIDNPTGINLEEEIRKEIKKIVRNRD